jgi:hypothetical protein
MMLILQIQRDRLEKMKIKISLHLTQPKNNEEDGTTNDNGQAGPRMRTPTA